MKRDKAKENPLAAAEMDEEENYNMIDGIINNTKKPPTSVLRQLELYEKSIALHNKEQDERQQEANNEER